jgi:hypothetical protein
VPRLIILVAALAMLSACSKPDAGDLACAAQARSGNLPWAYYPGYGCGPVPPAQTIYP